MELLDQSVGWLARNIPGSTQVFREHQMDFCCGGQHALRTVIAEKNLHAAPIVAQLQALQSRKDSSEQDWSTAPRVELIRHILDHYHAGHRRQLPELIRLAKRVEQVHGEREACPVGLANHLMWMQEELEQHMLKEEEILFPLLERGVNGLPISGPINVMRHEHDQHGEALAVLNDLTNDITLPQGACNTWRALYAGLTQLHDDLMQHIHLENNILFADAQGSLTA